MLVNEVGTCFTNYVKNLLQCCCICIAYIELSLFLLLNRLIWHPFPLRCLLQKLMLETSLPKTNMFPKIFLPLDYVSVRMLKLPSIIYYILHQQTCHLWFMKIKFICWIVQMNFQSRNPAEVYRRLLFKASSCAFFEATAILFCYCFSVGCKGSVA